jgi:hypothetical protein
MSRTVRSRLKMGGGHLRRDSYFLVVSFTSFVLYAICLYTFLHINGYIGAKDSVAAASPHIYAQDAAAKQPQREPSFVRSHAQFDDGKIHEFQHNVGQPVDWDMKVKGNEKKKQEKFLLVQRMLFVIDGHGFLRIDRLFATDHAFRPLIECRSIRTDRSTCPSWLGQIQWAEHQHRTVVSRVLQRPAE